MTDLIWKYVFVAAMSASMGACASSVTKPLKTGDVEPQQVIDVIQEYHSHWEDLDFQAVADFHSADFEYVFFDQVVPATAFPEILPTIWMKGVAVYSIQEENFDVVVIEPDHAFVTLAISDDTTYANGSVAKTSGMMSYLLRRDETWEIVRSHHSGPPPSELYVGEPQE